MNVSEFIFDFFSKKGIDTVFMITGGQAMWLNDAVGKNKQRPRQKPGFAGNQDHCAGHAESLVMRLRPDRAESGVVHLEIF